MRNTDGNADVHTDGYCYVNGNCNSNGDG